MQHYITFWDSVWMKTSWGANYFSQTTSAQTPPCRQCIWLWLGVRIGCSIRQSSLWSFPLEGKTILKCKSNAVGWNEPFQTSDCLHIKWICLFQRIWHEEELRHSRQYSVICLRTAPSMVGRISQCLLVLVLQHILKVDRGGDWISRLSIEWVSWSSLTDKTAVQTVGKILRFSLETLCWTKERIPGEAPQRERLSCTSRYFSRKLV